MGHKLQLIVGDFMKVELPYFDVCVANVPYQVCFVCIWGLITYPDSDFISTRI